LKKITAILLLSLIVFYLAGYRWLFSVLEENATARLELKISEGRFSDDQLIEIRIPLNMPYYSDMDYVDVYGEINFNGEQYRFVKRKISDNTLHLLCIPNKEKNSIAGKKNEFTKAVNDIPAGKPGPLQKNHLIKLLIPEFRFHETAVYENIRSESHLSFINKNSEIKDLFTPLTDTQPPESVHFS
jgi:hypothetical protein